MRKRSTLSCVNSHALLLIYVSIWAHTYLYYIICGSTVKCVLGKSRISSNVCIEELFRYANHSSSPCRRISCAKIVDDSPIWCFCNAPLLSSVAVPLLCVWMWIGAASVVWLLIFFFLYSLLRSTSTFLLSPIVGHRAIACVTKPECDDESKTGMRKCNIELITKDVHLAKHNSHYLRKWNKFW